MSARFDELMSSARAALARDDFQDAAATYEKAENVARDLGDEDSIDLAFCSRCSALIELGLGADQIPRLKEVLLRSRDPKNQFRAAYCTAVAYDIEGDNERAHSYARRSIDFVGQFDDPVYTSRGANLLGVLATRESRFDEAEDAFRRAIEAHQGLNGYHRLTEAQVKDNLGYVMMCTDRLEEGLRLCEEAQNQLESIGAEDHLYEVLQDLCYGYLLADQLDRAHECGERALDLAVDAEDALVAKNSLFLLSEIAVRRGDTFGARRYLRELTAYYPEAEVSEEIISIFLATDLSTVVNLRG